MTVCDNSRTYVPEVRQYYGLVLLCFQSRKYHVGTRNSCYLRTHILQVPHDISKHLESTVNLWNYAIVLLVVTRSFRLLNEYLSETCSIYVHLES
jgi:hypothetical protein